MSDTGTTADLESLAGAADATGAAGAAGATADGERGNRKLREGLVVSDKMHKTVVVAVEDRVQHPRYAKTIRRTSRLKAHDAENSAATGDRVLLMETRPLSATKRWRVVQVIERAK
jgi:small subunit ribosomal protein S17